MVENEIKFKNTTAITKIFQMKNRLRIVSGGTSAGKSLGILIWLIDYAQSTNNQVITVVAESVPHLLLGAVRDFKSIMSAHGYWQGSQWNESKHIYTFPRGGIIEFISFDKFGKAHGPRRDILFINEANNVPWNIADQLITRTRNIVWIDYNPSEEFWVYTELLPNRKDIDFITLTYLDNEALDPISRFEIESHKHNAAWWKVYGLGQLGVIESRIYSNWKIIEEIPHEARLERTGVDFGYSNDPTAIADVYYYNGGYILDEVVYQKGMSNKMIADVLTSRPKSLIIADSAEPKSIDELRTYNLVVLPANKGQGSVLQGIQFVQAQQISITQRSTNGIKEYRNYVWKTDKNGKIINEPEHFYSHFMDACRYAMNNLNSEQERRLIGEQQRRMDRNKIKSLNSSTR